MATNSFFDCLNSILSNKKYWMNSQTEHEYSPISINIGLSQHLDCILYVNEMNRNWQSVTPIMHYDYMFHSIRKMNRKYNKWAKKFPTEDIDLIKEYYQISKLKAEEYLSILTKDQLETIRQEVNHG